WTDRAHVDENLSRGEARQHSVWSFADSSDGGRIGHHGEREIGRAGNCPWRVSPLHPLFNQPLRLGARAVVTGHRMTLAEQTIHHLAAHHSQTDKSKFRHPPRTSVLNPNCIRTWCAP